MKKVTSAGKVTTVIKFDEGFLEEGYLDVGDDQGLDFLGDEVVGP